MSSGDCLLSHFITSDAHFGPRKHTNAVHISVLIEFVSPSSESVCTVEVHDYVISCTIIFYHTVQGSNCIFAAPKLFSGIDQHNLYYG